MPETSAPTSPDVLTSFRAGDEKALESVFRARFALLTEEAKAKLDEPDAAPKVVERAFTSAWAARSQFDSPDALDKFLHDAVREGAVREMKRRAMAHRMAALDGAKREKHEHARHGGETVDEAWAHVTTALHASANPDLHKEKAKADRHHAAEHIGAVAKERSWRVPILIGAGTLAVAAGLFLFLQRGAEDAAINGALESPLAVDQKTGSVQRGSLTLQDSTEVKLGPSTTLRTARDFNKVNRAVRLSGTASFEVKRATEPPFRVRVKNAMLTARGTTFDLRAYDREPSVFLRVREGSVDIKIGKAVTPIAGKTVIIDSTGALTDATPAQVESALGWTDGSITLNNVALRDALPVMQLWYGLHLSAYSPEFLDRPVTITVPLDSIQRAINAVTSATGLAFGYAGSNMILYDPKNKPKGVR